LGLVFWWWWGRKREVAGGREDEICDGEEAYFFCSIFVSATVNHILEQEFWNSA